MKLAPVSIGFNDMARNFNFIQSVLACLFFEIDFSIRFRDKIEWKT